MDTMYWQDAGAAIRGPLTLARQTSCLIGRMTSQIQPRTPPSSSASIPQGRIVSSVRHSNSQHAVQAVVRAVLSTKWSTVSVSLHCDIIRRKEVESVLHVCLVLFEVLMRGCFNRFFKGGFQWIEIMSERAFLSESLTKLELQLFFLVLLYIQYIHLYDATPSVASV